MTKHTSEILTTDSWPLKLSKRESKVVEAALALVPPAEGGSWSATELNTVETSCADYAAVKSLVLADSGEVGTFYWVWHFNSWDVKDLFLKSGTSEVRLVSTTAI